MKHSLYTSLFLAFITYSHIQAMEALSDAEPHQIGTNKRQRIEEDEKEEMEAIEHLMLSLIAGQGGSQFIFIPASQNAANTLEDYPGKAIVKIPLHGDVSENVSEILGMTIVGPIMVLSKSRPATDKNLNTTNLNNDTNKELK